MSDEQQDPKELQRAITSLIFNQPFFASILLRLERVRDEKCETMWTDGKRLGWSPKFVATLTHDELVGVLAHEVAHVAGLHPWRRGHRDPYAWNIACDQVVNQIVTEAGMRLPQKHIPPVAGKAAEELYQAPPPGGGGQGAGGQDPGGCGEVRVPTNDQGQQLSEAEMHTQEAEAKVMVAAAASQAKKMGKLPAGLERLVEQTLEPRVPWKEILSRFVDAHARTDYSFTRPNKRYAYAGFMLPSLWHHHIGNVIMAADTSGSIDQQMLQEVASEIIGCMELFAERGTAVELPVLWCDTKVYPQLVSEPEELKPKGGGGTAFSPVFAWVKKQGDAPAGLVYVTDGECNDFGPPPEYPVLWILTQRNDGFKPPFGEIAHIMNN